MKAPSSFGKLRRLLKLSLQLSSLPVARLTFRAHSQPDRTRAAYEHFTRPHPKYRLFRNKSMGMALIDLTGFTSPSAYLEAACEDVRGGSQSRKAESRGYALREIDRERCREDIARINAAAEERQPRTVFDPFDGHEKCRCFGAFDADGRLVAYCNVGLYGNFASADELAAYKNRDGVLYLMLTGIVCQMIEEGGIDYFMYDSFLEAKAGQRKFKRRLGFRPYRVRYDLV
jgi:hypothetical protein